MSEGVTDCSQQLIVEVHFSFSETFIIIMTFFKFYVHTQGNFFPLYHFLSF